MIALYSLLLIPAAIAAGLLWGFCAPNRSAHGSSHGPTSISR